MTLATHLKRIAQLIMMAAAQPKPVGQVEWTVAGTYTWVVPDNVYFISAAAVGGAGGGGIGVSGNPGRAAYGPGLRYAVSIPVTPGETLTIIVGAGGASRALLSSTTPTVGGNTRIQRNGVDLLWAQGSQANVGGGGSPFDSNIGGGNGGTGALASSDTDNAGAGGAGGYAGNGGNGNASLSNAAGGGAGGGGGGGTASGSNYSGGRGGGVGLRGQGANGAGANATSVSNGGDGSVTAGPVVGRASGASRGTAGAPGTLAGLDGGARIIYGEGRFYPSTRTADE